jgi:nitrate reductase NapA
MTRRVPALHRAMPFAQVWLNADDAKALAIAEGDGVTIASRRGQIIAKAAVGGRNSPPKGAVFVPFFDERVLVNLVTLDSYCPISKEPDFKKCAVRVTKA